MKSYWHKTILKHFKVLFNSEKWENPVENIDLMENGKLKLVQSQQRFDILSVVAKSRHFVLPTKLSSASHPFIK